MKPEIKTIKVEKFVGPQWQVHKTTEEDNTIIKTRFAINGSLLKLQEMQRSELMELRLLIEEALKGA